MKTKLKGDSSFSYCCANTFAGSTAKLAKGDRLPDKNKEAFGSRRLRRNTRQQNPLKHLTSLLFPSKLRPPLKLMEDHVLSILIARRARGAVLGNDLFSDPAWDILLELYAAKLGRRSMSLSELARATETPPSTTRRWIAALEERRLVSSAIDPAKPSRVQVELTTEGASKIEHLADHWGSAFVSI